MVRSASSRGVNVARGVSLDRRFIQYWQSYMQALVISTFNKEMHRPSDAKLWQMPIFTALPSFPFFPPRSIPLGVQATSYLAASVRMVSFSMVVIENPSYKHMFDTN